MDSTGRTFNGRRSVDVSDLPSYSPQRPGYDFQSSPARKRLSFDPSLHRPKPKISAKQKLEIIEERLNELKSRDSLNIEPLKHCARRLTDIENSRKKWTHKDATSGSSPYRSKSASPGRVPFHPSPGRAAPYQNPDSNIPPGMRRRGWSSATASERRKNIKYTPSFKTILLLASAVLLVVYINYALLRQMQGGNCDANLKMNLTEFTADLHDKVYGQHIALDIVPRLIEQNILLPRGRDTKPLVMAFLVSTLRSTNINFGPSHEKYF